MLVTKRLSLFVLFLKKVISKKKRMEMSIRLIEEGSVELFFILRYFESIFLFVWNVVDMLAVDQTRFFV
jgi:hypothetical protein